MPYRLTPLVSDNYYHILNRGAAHQPTFKVVKDYDRFLFCISYYRHKDPPVKLSRLLQIPKDERLNILSRLEKNKNNQIEIIAYCFMPNHVHLLVKQTTDGGITQFMRRVTDGYTRYYNTKHDRNGPLFQGAFKAVHISSGEQLTHVSRYIHLNPLVSAVVADRDFLDYPWSSLRSYVGDKGASFVYTKPVMEYFRTASKYLEFVMNRADYGRRLEEIKHLALEQ